MTTIKSGESDGRTHLEKVGQHGPLLPNRSCFVGEGEIKTEVVPDVALQSGWIVKRHGLEPLKNLFHERKIYFLAIALIGLGERRNAEEEKKLVNSLK